MKDNTHTVDPLFKKGIVPFIPHAEIQNVRLDSQGGYHYFINNKYNPWASGWMPEDMLVRYVSENQKTNLNP